MQIRVPAADLGREANVAVSTANYGIPSAYVTALPANHAIVDGAPFARFVGAWSRRVAAAEGLEDTLARRSA